MALHIGLPFEHALGGLFGIGGDFLFVNTKFKANKDVLIMHGTADEVIDWNLSKEFYKFLEGEERV